MADIQTENPVEAAVTSLAKAVAIAKVNYPRIQDRCAKAVVLLSKIQDIQDDATDELAEKYLVKVRDVYNESVNERKAFTMSFDDFKEIAMQPEKTISTDDKATASAYFRVKALRNKYAQAKLDKSKADQAKIDAKAKHDSEVNKVTIAFDQAMFDGVTALVLAIDGKMESYFKGIEYENYPEKSQQLIKTKPALKQEQYDGFFKAVTFNSALITTIEFNEISDTAKKTFTFEKVNSDYIARATPKLKEWIDKLPGKKQALDELKKLTDQNNAAAASALKAKQEAQALADAEALRQKNEADAKAQTEAKTESLVQKEQDLNTDVMFRQQVAVQSIAAPTGTIKKVATIVGDEEEIVVIISELFYSVFMHPKFKGIIQRDKTGMLKYDESGRPVYEEWLEKILDFYANNCDAKIEGIELKDSIRTTQKAVK